MGGRSSPGAMALPLPRVSAVWPAAGGGLTFRRVGSRAVRREADSAESQAGEPALLTPAAAEERAPDLIAGCVRGDASAREEFVAQYDGLIRYATLIVLRQRGVVFSREEIEDLHHVILAAF